MLRRGLEGCRAEEGLAVDTDADAPEVGVAAAVLPVVGGDQIGDEVVPGDTVRELEPREIEEAEVAEGGLRVAVVGPAAERGWRLVDVVLAGVDLPGPAARADHGRRCGGALLEPAAGADHGRHCL